ncbi:MAG: AAA family ATPase [Muribaculaceae bacterium]|nr:AAA family ATPase [Muribaculaceae bacterium]
MALKKKNIIDDNADILPLLALPQIVLTPLIPQPIKVDNELQIKMLDSLVGENSHIFVATSLPDEQNEANEQILEYGLVCIVDRLLQMPGAPTLAFLRPINRAKFLGIVFNENYPMAKIKSLKNFSAPKRFSRETDMMLERVDILLGNTMQYVSEPEKMTAQKIIEENSHNVLLHLYAVSHVAPFQWNEKYEILKCNTFNQLLTSLLINLDEADQKVEIQAQIQERTHRELSQQQKEAFLRIHLKQVRDELGDSDENDMIQLKLRASSKNWDENASKHFDKELKKLERLNINNPEYSVQHAYLEALLDLPWNNYQHSEISIDKVEQILNRDHYGLENVKERILEYVAVLKLRNDLKAPILCLYGPPGVGKTSIGKSVAEALGREYARISLGGMHDEAEIRGHRRTYIGAMPGRFLHSLSKLQSGNPLILLDEIDKVGQDYKGDPSSALLEALDPEQNNTFHDNFIDYPYDLSKVLFIATANDIASIPPPLRDRMEVIEMARYSHMEKREIAMRHLVVQVLKENGFTEDEISFTPEAIDTIIQKFTHEAGVRQLKMQISKVVRKLALMKVRGKKMPAVITGNMVANLLDKRDSYHSSLGFHA